MLRVAAFAGGGLEFLGTLSKRLFVLYAWRTVVPVDQGVYRVGNAHMQCHVFLVVRLPAYTAVVRLLQQTQQRRWTRDR